MPAMNLADHTAHYRRDAEYFDYFAPRSGADLDAACRIQQAVLAAMPAVSSGAVLDLGSGDGWLHAALASRTRTAERNDTAAVVVSCDLGINNLRKIRQRQPAALLVAADAGRLPFRDGSFEVVVASEVLEHLNAPGDVVRALANILAPKGRIVVTTPYRETIRYSLCIHCNEPTPVNAHLHSFDESALGTFFMDAGLARIRHETFQNKAMVFLRLSYFLRFLPWRLWRVIDRLCNFVYPKPHSIVMTGDRIETHAP